MKNLFRLLTLALVAGAMATSCNNNGPDVEPPVDKLPFVEPYLGFGDKNSEGIKAFEKREVAFDLEAIGAATPGSNFLFYNGGKDEITHCVIYMVNEGKFTNASLLIPASLENRALVPEVLAAHYETELNKDGSIKFYYNKEKTIKVDSQLTPGSSFVAMTTMFPEIPIDNSTLYITVDYVAY